MTTNNNITNSPFLPNSRRFPPDLKPLVVEIDRSYIDIANVVNNRIIALFPANKSTLTGETWFITNQAQQTFRQIYSFTTTNDIPHGINFDTIYGFSRMWGQFTDGTNWYGLIPGTNVNTITGQISFYLSPTNIIFEVDAIAPSVDNGIIVLEWLANP
jgi:hypothetical protein